MEREQGLATTPGVPQHYSGIKTCPQVRVPLESFSRGTASSVKPQFLGKSVVSADHLSKAECKREVSANACGSAGKLRVMDKGREVEDTEQRQLA